MSSTGDVQDTAGRGLTRREAIRTGSAGLAVLLAPAFVAACGSSESTGGAAKLTGPVISGQSFAPTTFDPHTASEIGGITVIAYAYEGLYGRSPRPPYDITAQLAAGDPQPVSDTVQRIALRDGAKFHDGSPVTAADVVASVKRLLAKDTASFLAGYLTMVKDIKAVDDHTVELHLNFATSFLKDRIGLVKVVPKSLAEGKNAKKTFDTKPVGSGPYRIDSIGRDLRSARLSDSADYNGPYDVALKQIGMDVILDDQARIAALQSKRLAAMVDPPFQAIDRLDADPNLNAQGADSFQQSIVLFNCAKRPFDDKRVRQAFLYAIDRDTITKSVFFGHAEAATSYLPASHPDYVEPATKYEYDPERAKSLLADAGVSNLSFTLNLSNPGWLAPQGPLIQSQLKDIGVDVKLRQGETESLVKYALDGSYQAWLTPTDPSVFGNTDGEFLIRWVYVNLAPGFIYWTNAQAKKLAGLLDQALRSTSKDALPPLYKQMQDIIADEAPAFPLHHRQNVAAWGTGLELKPDPVYSVNLLGASAAS
jgi:peptide/nickel transport system substrate-binding protein